MFKKCVHRRSGRRPLAILGPAALGLGLLWGASPGLAQPQEAAKSQEATQADPLLPVLKAELARNQKLLRLDTQGPPYFIGYRAVEHEEVALLARFGALEKNERKHFRRAAVDVRVGDYTFDSSTRPDDLLGLDIDMPTGLQLTGYLPLGQDEQALQTHLWLLTDQAYKQALSTYLKKRAKQVHAFQEEKKADSFTREQAVRFQEVPRPLQVDRALWAQRVERASRRLRAPDVLEGAVELVARRDRMYLVNTEGSELVQEQVIYQLVIELVAQAPDGMLLDQGQTLYGRTLDELPDEQALDALVDETLAQLRALVKAPLADPYTGPALFEPEAAGVFFHETIGHRLEGERQNEETEGRTFKGQVGKVILPTFLSIHDDPTLRTLNGESLNGYYRYDQQGVPAQRVALVEAGVLKNFLTSRTPVEGSTPSNGHGRAANVRDPIARMGNLIVEGTAPVPSGTLKERLLAEVRRQNKPYGLIIRDITGGSTNTSNYGYQVFKGAPRMVYQVDAETGEETLVRGVEVVGTPLTAVNKVIAVGDKLGVFNGYCGAESGYVPVSAIAPATLFSEIELQRSQKEKLRAPILPAPWTQEGGGEGS